MDQRPRTPALRTIRLRRLYDPGDTTVTTAVLKSALRFSGAAAFRWHTLLPGLYCFNYHRIGNPLETDFDRGVFSCTAERFEQHVAAIQRRFDLLDLPRLAELLDRDGGPRRPSALITFDDGYADNFSLAFPILRRLGATAVFFLPTAFIGTSLVPWWDAIAWSLRRSVRQRLRLDGWPREVDLGDGDQRDLAIRQALQLVRSNPRLPLDEQARRIGEVCGVGQPSPATPLFMDWDQVRRMRSAGMEFGSHTHSHRVLAHLDAAAQRQELAQSKATMESQLGGAVHAVAYPVGTADAYTPETCRLARETGYEMGFTFRRYVNRWPVADRYQLGRLAVDEDAPVRDLRLAACFPGRFG